MGYGDNGYEPEPFFSRQPLVPNKFDVEPAISSSGAKGVMIVNPPGHVITPQDAMHLATWLEFHAKGWL